MKIVINVCYGGFGLSHEAVELIATRKGLTLYPDPEYGNYGVYWTEPPGERTNDHHWSANSISREDLDLISVVEEIGSRANARCAELKVVEIPDDVEYRIVDHDGSEHVAEAHRTWS